MSSTVQIRKNYQTTETVVVTAAVVAIIVVYLLGDEGDVAHDTLVPVHEVACVPLLDQYNL